MSLDLPNEGPSLALCRQMLRTMLRRVQMDAARAFDLELVLNEAAANVLRHAYPQPGHHYGVIVELFPDRVRLQVVDHGRGFVHTPAPGCPLERAHSLPPDADQVAGRGLWLIERLADTTTVRTIPGGGCLVEAEFNFSPPLTLLPPAAAPEAVRR